MAADQRHEVVWWQHRRQWCAMPHRPHALVRLACPTATALGPSHQHHRAEHGSGTGSAATRNVRLLSARGESSERSGRLQERRELACHHGSERPCTCLLSHRRRARLHVAFSSCSANPLHVAILLKQQTGTELGRHRFSRLLYHFLNMQTGRRVWTCERSTVDSAFLLAGALTGSKLLRRRHRRRVRNRDRANLSSLARSHSGDCVDLLHGTDFLPGHVDPIARRRDGSFTGTNAGKPAPYSTSSRHPERRATCHGNLIHQQRADRHSVGADHQKTDTEHAIGLALVQRFAVATI